MKINIDNLKVETIDYIDGRGYKHPKKGLRDLKKMVSVKFNTNSISIDVLKHQLNYYPYIKANWYKGRNTDSLFLELIGVNHQLIMLFNRYNDILTGITYQEKRQLEYIRRNSYISKKYILDDDVTDEEYGVYEPINTIDYYDDYDNIYNQNTFKNKRINYNKKPYKKQDVVTKTLERACENITDFKFTKIPIKITSFEDIFKYRVKACSFKLHNHYHRVESNYDSYEDFLKYVIFYGASHYSNHIFWKNLKRELY